MKRKSLRRKIQSSLMASSMLSILLAMIGIFSIIIFIARPIGDYFVFSINEKIVNNFTKYSNFASNYDRHSGIDEFRVMSYEDLKLIDFSNTSEIKIEKEFEIMQEEFSKSQDHFIYVHGDGRNKNISDDEKKNILLSIYKSIEETDGYFTISEIMNLDLINISFEIDGHVEKSIPSEAYIKEIDYGSHFKNIENYITIYDLNDYMIGSIKTSLNSGIIYVATIPIIILFILIAIFTLIIVKIFTRPLTKSLIKPVNDLNMQLEKISNDNIEINHVVIEQKKPPAEIEKLISYSNTIMNRLRTSLHEIENQKDELEAQNMELDVQNSELIISQDALRTAQDSLVQSEKLASMGQLTAAIAHEINTPLGAVSSNNQMIEIMLLKLESKLKDQAYDEAIAIISKLKKSNSISMDAAQRVNEIIRNLRNFSRIDQAKFQKADINEGIQSVLVLTSNLWKNKVTLNEDYGKIPEISCFPSMLNQVFMNIIVNAIQASEKNGHIKITTRALKDSIKIYISDNGMGILEDNLDRVFNSGFTTKPKDAGTGLGLSISRDIIKKHHGDICAYNNEDQGATFEITLPMLQSPSECDHS